MEVKDLIKNRRLELRLTLSDVAKFVGVNEGTVSRWESGDISNMRRDKIALLSKILQISPLAIMGFDDVDQIEETQTIDVKNIVPIPRIRIPIVGTIAAGVPILAEENIEDYVDFDSPVKFDFALRIKGSSMINANIHDGDLVFIKKQDSVDNGQIAAVLIDDEATLKRVYRQETSIMLVAENPEFAPMVFSEHDAKNIRIIGKAVYVMKSVK